MKPSLTMGLISLKVYLFKKYIKENLAGFYLLSRIYLDLLTFFGGGRGGGALLYGVIYWVLKTF